MLKFDFRFGQSVSTPQLSVFASHHRMLLRFIRSPRHPIYLFDYLHILPAFQPLPDTVSGSNGFGQYREHLGNGHHGIQNNGKVGGEGKNFAHLGGSAVHTVSSDQNYPHKPQIQQNVHGGIDNCHYHSVFSLPLHYLSVYCAEFFGLVIRL